MSKQRIDLMPNANQKKILELEKKYFNQLEDIITSKEFLDNFYIPARYLILKRAYKLFTPVHLSTHLR